MVGQQHSIIIIIIVHQFKSGICTMELSFLLENQDCPNIIHGQNLIGGKNCCNMLDNNEKQPGRLHCLVTISAGIGH